MTLEFQSDIADIASKIAEHLGHSFAVQDAVHIVGALKVRAWFFDKSGSLDFRQMFMGIRVVLLADCFLVFLCWGILAVQTVCILCMKGRL